MNIQRIRDRYHARPGYWFRPKLLGYGAVPVTWQGWAVTLAFVAIVGVLSIFLKVRGHDAYLLVLVPVVIGFVWLTWVKTDGAWRWRWGPDE